MQTNELKESEPNADINTTPLIDVMLVLLIMLIVTLPPQRHAVKLDTPLPCQGCAQPGDLPKPITIAVDFDGSMKWNGVPASSGEIDRRLGVESRRVRQPEIYIEPHRLAQYRNVAHVMAVAQREGLKRMGVIGGT